MSLKFLGFVLIALTMCESSKAQFYQPPVQWVGISRDQMNYSAASQEKDQWCWAASIQMIMRFYGVDISQRDIAKRTYGLDENGDIRNSPGSNQAITANLNNWGVDDSGHRYVVQCFWGQGAPSPAVLVAELAKYHPVMAAYNPGYQIGHAVVITAVSFTGPWQAPIIQSIVIRDPWPSPENIQNKGRVEFAGADLARVMTSYWYTYAVAERR